MALPFVNLFSAVEVVPGGRFGVSDPGTESLLNNLNTVINNIVNEVNNVSSTTVNIALGQGGGVRPVTIGYTTPGRSDISLESITKGNEILRLHTSGQMIVAWREYTGAGALYEIFLKKAYSPYLQWTNLAGDSQEPTKLAPPFTQTANQSVVICVNRSNGDLNVFTYDTTALAIKQYIYSFDGANFSLSTSNNTVIGAPVGLYLGDALSTADRMILLASEGGGVGASVGNVITALNNIPTAWGQVARYGNTYFGGAIFGFTGFGDQKRLIDMGGGRILALMETCSSTVADQNIAWAMSKDNGATWPQGDTTTSTLQEINYPGDATGWVIPQTAGGAWNTGNIMNSGFGGFGVHACWNAAPIAGTSRVGLVFLGKPDPTTAGQLSGILYTEFDADALSWTPQASHVRLTPQCLANVAGTSSKLTYSSGGFAWDMAGKCICGSDGVVRVFWMHGYDLSGNDDPLTGIHYRRLASDGVATDTSDWWSEREVIPFSAITPNAAVRFGEFCGCKEGAVIINGKLFYPVMWTQRQGSFSKNMAYTELMLALIPIGLIDLP